MSENRPGLPKIYRRERLIEGWRGTLREVWIVKVTPARGAEVHFKFVKLECENEDHLGQNQERNEVQRLPSHIWFEGLFKQGYRLGRAPLRQKFGNGDGRGGLRRLVKGKLCL
jgi:hypothetical protein